MQAHTLSPPIDLNYISARLEEITTNREASPLPCSPSPTLPPPSEEEELEEETEYYNALISEGGRPSHPVSLGRNILEDPGEYRDTIVLAAYEQRCWREGIESILDRAV